MAMLGTTLAVAAPGAMAAMITVNSTADMSGEGQCTLRDAITAANNNEMTGSCMAGNDDNDTIVFGDSVAGSTITLNGTALPAIASGTTLVIGGMQDSDDSDDNGASAGVTIDADGQSRIFTNQGNLTLNGLTLTNGTTMTGDAGADDRSGGAILNDDGGVLTVNGGAMNNNTADRAGGAIEEASGAAAGTTAVTLNDVDLSGNDAGMNPGNGGALHVTGSGDVVVNGGTFSGNISEEGGALWNNGGTLTVTDATFTENVANGTAADMGGGAIFGQVEGANGTIIISGSSFVSNTTGNSEDGDSSASGGAILTGDGTTLEISDSVFRMNSARRAGGAIEVLAGSTTTLTNVTGTENDAGMNPGNGGFLHVTGDGDVTVTGGIYARNVAVEGGAFWNNQGEMGFDGVSIVNNEATGDDADQGGGGIFGETNDAGMDSGTLTIASSRIAMNRASGTSGSGGGVFVNAGATANITDTRIEANQANRAGAGIENAGGTVTLDGVTLGGASEAQGNVIGPNANPGNGGGLHIGGSGSTTVTNSTVGYNQATEGGGLWNSQPGTLSVDTSTVSDNTADTGAGIYQDGGDSDAAAANGIVLDYASIVNNTGTGLDAANPEGAYTVTNSLIAANDTNLGDESFATDGEDGNVIGDAALLDGMYRLYGGPTATQPLAMDSAALDTNADCGAMDTDQRGAERDFDVPDVDNGGTCDSGAYELTDDPVVQVEMIDLENAVVTQDDSEVTVLGFTLANSSENSVTVGGFSGYVDRDDMLPPGVDLADVELTVYEDGNDNGSYDMGSDMEVGSGSLDNGYTFTVDFQDGAGVSIAAGDSTSYLVVARLSDDDTAMPATAQASVSGFGGAPLYAGGALLGLLGLVSVGGIRRRTPFLLIVAALALTLTACSDDDGNVRVDNGDQPGNGGQQPGDGMGQGEAVFVLQQLNATSNGDDTDLVIGDGLPVRGPMISFEMPSTDEDAAMGGDSDT